MRAKAASALRRVRARLGELAIGERDDVLPAVPAAVVDLGLVVGIKIQVDVVLELLDTRRAVVQEYLGRNCASAPPASAGNCRLVTLWQVNIAPSPVQV